MTQRTTDALLDWYFGEGQAAFERSTCGAMLDRAALYSVREPVTRAEITARPRPASRAEQGYTPDERDLERYAEASRRLRMLSAEHARTLAAYYGDEGARWGRTDLGRIVAVMPLTEAGAQLLERARKRAESLSAHISGLSPSEQLGTELEAQRAQPQASRSVLVDRARVQAIMMYGRALDAWQATARPARPGWLRLVRGLPIAGGG